MLYILQALLCGCVSFKSELPALQPAASASIPQIWCSPLLNSGISNGVFCSHTWLTQVASAVSAAAVECANQQLALIRRFAAQTSGISCNQLVTILQLLKVQGWRYRCGVIVALWAKVVDRNRLVEVSKVLRIWYASSGQYAHAPSCFCAHAM